MLIVAAVISAFTFTICIWNIVYHAEYLYNPGYDIFLELLMMFFVCLEAYLFYSYVKGEEDLEDAPSDGSSDGSSPSPLATRNPPPTSNVALNNSMSQGNNTTILVAEESLDQEHSISEDKSALSKPNKDI